MYAGHYQKIKIRLQKRFMKGIKIFLKKSKMKSVNMLVNDIEIFLKKRKTKSDRLPEDEK